MIGRRSASRLMRILLGASLLLAAFAALVPAVEALCVNYGEDDDWDWCTVTEASGSGANAGLVFYDDGGEVTVACSTSPNCETTTGDPAAHSVSEEAACAADFDEDGTYYACVRPYEGAPGVVVTQEDATLTQLAAAPSCSTEDGVSCGVTVVRGDYENRLGPAGVGTEAGPGACAYAFGGEPEACLAARASGREHGQAIGVTNGPVDHEADVGCDLDPGADCGVSYVMTAPPPNHASFAQGVRVEEGGSACFYGGVDKCVGAPDVTPPCTGDALSSFNCTLDLGVT